MNNPVVPKKLAGAEGKDAKLTALDDYQVDITADEMAQHQPILSLELDGATLIGHDFGPYFVMWPFKEKPEIDNDAFQAKAIPIPSASPTMSRCAASCRTWAEQPGACRAVACRRSS